MPRLQVAIGITVLSVLAVLRPIQAAAQESVPPLVQISGDLADQKGRVLSGPQTVTFALYKEQSGDAPLWVEVQVVTADAKGHFVALLGATSPGGLPLDLFSTGQARWLGMQSSGQPEQPRTFLASVPYALAPLSAITSSSSVGSNASTTQTVGTSVDAPAGRAPSATASLTTLTPGPPPSPVFTVVTDSTSGLASSVTNNGATVALTLIKTCATGQLLKWNGTAWGCTADTDVTIDVTGGGLNVLANGTSPNIVSGYGGNAVVAGAFGATIGGGGEKTLNGGFCLPGQNCQAINLVTESFGTVSGGENNQAGANSGTPAVRSYSTVAGGLSNTASGLYSTVPGGTSNTAAGLSSFAAGFNAKANHSGSFVWSDHSSSAPFASTAPNQFLLRASGGVGINTNAPIATLDVRGDLNLQDSSSTGVIRFPAGGLFLRDNVNNLDRLFVSGSTGYVGVGTHSPSQALDVAGNVNVAGSMNVAGTSTVANLSSTGNVTAAGVVATGPVAGTQLCIGSDCRNSWPSSFSIGGGINAVNQRPNSLTKFLDLSTIGSSNISDDGSNVLIAGSNINIAVNKGGLRVASVPGFSPNIVGGDASNAVASPCSSSPDPTAPPCTDQVYGATIAGGGATFTDPDGVTTQPNSVTGTFGTVGGGLGNTAGANATIGGGQNNSANGTAATVPGGQDNIASGSWSLAAGHGAAANHDSTFVWSDGPAFPSTGSNQFLLHASGGVGIGTNAPSEALDVNGNVKGTGLCIGTDCRTAWPSGSGGGTITGVTAGTGLTGGGSSGSVSLGVDFAAVQKRVTGTCASGFAIQGVNGDGTVGCGPVGGLNGSGTPNAILKFLDNGTVGAARIIDNGGKVIIGSNGGGLVILNPTDGSTPNIQGGGRQNNIDPLVFGATISGGGDNSAPDGLNSITAHFGTIGGGTSNTVNGLMGTVAGGQKNTGGEQAAVGGGFGNTASGKGAAIAGGQNNAASGPSATVPGGSNNFATGAFSLAAGQGAAANDHGAFVWADSSDLVNQFASTGPDQFLIRATGGVGIGTNSPAEALDVVGNVKGDGLCIGSDCRTAWPSGGGSGTITSVTAGAGLSGGGTSGDVTLAIPAAGITNAMLQHNLVGINVATGLLGGGAVALGSSIAIGIDNSIVPRLNFPNTFTVAQSVTAPNANGGALTVTNTATGGGWGVFASTPSLSGSAALRGDATATTGSSFGVLGQSFATSGIGVEGVNQSATGTNFGVRGETQSNGVNSAGVYGAEGSLTGTTFGVFGQSVSTAGVAVYGTEPSSTGTVYGVYGTTASTSGTGVFGQATATTGSATGGHFSSFSNAGNGVWGSSDNSAGFGIGVLGTASSASGVGGLFSNSGGGDLIRGTTTAVQFRVASSGNVTAAGTFTGGGADFAESVDVADGADAYEPGDVMAVDPTSNRRFAKASEPYSSLVAGIYSTKPGVLGSRTSMDAARTAAEVPMAVVGIVPTKVSAENGPIERGDLLVASSTPGYAMKGTDRSRMLGAVIGKALEPLAEGKGLIEVLVTVR